MGFLQLLSRRKEPVNSEIVKQLGSVAILEYWSAKKKSTSKTDFSLLWAYSPVLSDASEEV